MQEPGPLFGCQIFGYDVKEVDGYGTGVNAVKNLLKQKHR
jgi:hypothetical protein